MPTGGDRSRALEEDYLMLVKEGFLTVGEAAELLGVAPNTVRSWGSDGRIPEYRHPVNNYRLYKREELGRVLQQLEESVTKPPVQKRKPK